MEKETKLSLDRIIEIEKENKQHLQTNGVARKMNELRHKISRTTKKALSTCAILGFLVGFYTPLAIKYSNDIHLCNRPSAISVKDFQESAYRLKQRKSRDALGYLNLSNLCVHISDTVQRELQETGMRQRTKEPCCTDYSLATFDLYNTMIKDNGRKDLQDKLRICVGTVYVSKNNNLIGTEGHMWLEVNYGNKWHTYETTIPFEFGSPYRNAFKKDELVDLVKINSVYFRTAPGTKIPIPTNIPRYIFPFIE